MHEEMNESVVMLPPESTPQHQGQAPLQAEILAGKLILNEWRANVIGDKLCQIHGACWWSLLVGVSAVGCWVAEDAEVAGARASVAVPQRAAGGMGVQGAPPGEGPGSPSLLLVSACPRWKVAAVPAKDKRPGGDRCPRAGGGGRLARAGPGSAVWPLVAVTKSGAGLRECERPGDTPRAPSRPAVRLRKSWARVGMNPWRRKWQSTPVLLPGKSQGWRSVVGYSPWDHKESDMTE